MIPDLVIDAAAAYRVTRLVTADTITAPARDALIEKIYERSGSMAHPLPGESWSEMAERDPDAPKSATLLVCRWCAGAWISAGIIVARRLAPRQWGPVADAAACSAAAALLARFETD